MKRLLQTAAALALCPLLSSAQQNLSQPVIPVPPPASATSPAPVGTQVITPVPGAPVSSPPAPGSELPAAAQVSASYIIGPEDAITVNVWKEQSLSGPYAVRPDGMISMPLLGDLPAAGLTPMALGTDIATRLKKYLTDPLVTVTVAAVNSKHYYMVGEVGHTGALPLTPGMSLIQAIAAGGGLSPYANAKHIYILRTDKGKQMKIPFNYKKAIKDGDQQGVILLSGDTIVVP